MKVAIIIGVVVVIFIIIAIVFHIKGLDYPAPTGF